MTGQNHFGWVIAIAIVVVGGYFYLENPVQEAIDRQECRTMVGQGLNDMTGMNFPTYVDEACR
jgi:hypothetical protein